MAQNTSVKRPLVAVVRCGKTGKIKADVDGVQKLMTDAEWEAHLDKTLSKKED